MTSRSVASRHALLLYNQARFRVMIAVPLTITAKKMGFNMLADLQMLGLEYQYTAMATTRDMIKSRPDLARAWLGPP